MKLRLISVWLLLFCLLTSNSLYAQDTSTLLQINSDTTNLETGETYQLRIEVHDATDLWATNVLIEYDPSMIYIVGTKSGSPVKIGDMMSDGGDTIFNSVIQETNRLNYAVSMFNPADPVSGTGVIGTFEIVPLLAGTTQLSFFQADVLSVEFSTDANGQRAGNPVDMAFLPVLLELSITGDPATPPSELTATPQPTVTVDPALIPGGLAEETEEGLVNVTAAPTTNEAVDTEQGFSSSTLLIFSVVMVFILGFGLIGLFFYTRSRR